MIARLPATIGTAQITTACDVHDQLKRVNYQGTLKIRRLVMRPMRKMSCAREIRGVQYLNVGIVLAVDAKGDSELCSGEITDFTDSTDQTVVPKAVGAARK